MIWVCSQSRLAILAIASASGRVSYMEGNKMKINFYRTRLAVKETRV